MSAATSARRAAWTGASRAARLLGLGGLHDLGRLGTVFVPALSNSAIQTSRLLAPGESAAARYVERPPRSLAAAERFESAFEPGPLPRRPSTAVTVEGARLVGALGSLVDPATGRLYAESASDRPAQMGKHLSLLRPRVLAPVERKRGPLVFLASYDSRNYFHFVSDALTRLHAFGADSPDGLEGLRAAVSDLEFVLDAAGPRWQRDYLELLGLRVTEARLSDRTNWLVDRLVFPTFVGQPHPRFGASMFPGEVLHWLRRVLLEAAGAEEGRRRRLYVTRRSAPTRRLDNEPEVTALVERHGFETVIPDELTVRDQIRLFAAADAIVAPHGAGLTNILFATPVPVVELVSPLHVVPCFYFLAEPLGHDYWYLMGETDAAAADFTADYSIDVETLEKTLAAAGLG